MNMTVTALEGEKFTDFARRVIMNKEVGEFKFNNFTFVLKGDEGFNDYCKLNAEFWNSQIIK